MEERICCICGASLPDGRRTYCSDACAEEGARRLARRETEKRERLGPVRDRTCIECGRNFVGSIKSTRCPSCQAERDKQTKREYAQRAAAGTCRHIGSTAYCQWCGEPYTVKSGLQKYCPSCAPIAIRKKKHELSKAWNREHYYSSDEARKAHNESYRVGKTIETVCPECGMTFQRKGNSKYCSEECRSASKRKYMEQYDESRKEIKAARNKDAWAGLTREEKDEINRKQRERYAKRKANGTGKPRKTVKSNQTTQPKTLSELREAQGLTRSELAKLLGCTYQGVRQLEKKEAKRFNSDVVAKLATLLKCSEDDIWVCAAQDMSASATPQSQADAIKNLRLAKGWTQKELATRIGVSASVISLWESHKSTPNSTSKKLLAEIFGCKIDDLKCPKPQSPIKEQKGLKAQNHRQSKKENAVLKTRIERRLTRDGLAAAVGVKESLLEKLEKGEIGVSRSCMLKLSKALSCHLEELFPAYATYNTALLSRRIEKKYTLQKLANCLGVSCTLMKLWEQSVYTPQPKYQKKLAELLDCAIEDLFKPDAQ